MMRISSGAEAVNWKYRSIDEGIKKKNIRSKPNGQSCDSGGRR